MTEIYQLKRTMLVKDPKDINTWTPFSTDLRKNHGQLFCDTDWPPPPCLHLPWGVIGRAQLSPLRATGAISLHWRWKWAGLKMLSVPNPPTTAALTQCSLSYGRKAHVKEGFLMIKMVIQTSATVRIKWIQQHSYLKKKKKGTKCCFLSSAKKKPCRISTDCWEVHWHFFFL